MTVILVCYVPLYVSIFYADDIQKFVYAMSPPCSAFALLSHVHWIYLYRAASRNEDMEEYIMTSIAVFFLSTDPGRNFCKLF